MKPLNAHSVSLSGAILDGSPTPTLLVSAGGLVLTHNPAAEAFAAVLDSPAGESAKRLVDSAFRAHQGQTGLVEVVGADGVAEYELTVLPTEEGETMLVLARDATADHALRLALMDSRRRYKDLVEISSDFAWETGSDGEFVFVSPEGALGFRADELVGRRADEFLLETSSKDETSPFRAKGRVVEAETWMRRADGRAACLTASAGPLVGPDGRWAGARGICRDVTQARERDAALANARNREQVLTRIVRSFRDEVDPTNMLTVAAKGIARGLSSDGCQILHAEAPEGEARLPQDYQLAAVFGETGGEASVGSLGIGLAGGAELLEVAMGKHLVLAAPTRYQRRVNGAVCLWRQAGRTPWRDDERILISDIANQIGIANEQIFHHQRIVQISRTDALTGLFNRRAFFEELDRRFSRLTREDRDAALLYVDLDNFKPVNDHFGHAKGDEALLKVREILLGNTRPTDLVARLGGDEFAVWLEGADAQIAEERAKAMIESCIDLKDYCVSEGKPLAMSIGIAVHDPTKSESREALIRRADEAMYAVKKDGKGSYLFAPKPKG